MKPVRVAKNRADCAPDAKGSSQRTIFPLGEAPLLPGAAQSAAEQLLEEGPVHQHGVGRDADLVEPGLLEHAGQPAADAAIAKAVRHPVEDSPARRPVGMVHP